MSVTAMVHSQSNPSKRPPVISGILILGLGLRCLAINQRGIWYDDAFSIFLSHSSPGQIILGTAADTMPPLYYFLLHYWMKIGQTVWFLRSLNILLSLGVIYLVIWWTNKAFGWSAAILAGLFTAISPFQIYHAQEIRMYMLLCLALTGYLFLFEQIYHNQNHAKIIYWIGFVFCGTAALYSHNLAIFTLLVPNVYLLIRRDWKFQIRTIKWQLLILLAALPWLAYLPGQINKIQTAFWTPRPGLVEIVQAILAFQSNLPLPSWALILSAIVSIEFLVILFLEIYRKYRMDQKIHFLLTAWLFPPLIMFFISYLMRPVFVPRAFIFSSIAYPILAGVVFSGIQKGKVNRSLFSWILTGIWCLVSIIGIVCQATYAEFPRSPYQKASEFLVTGVQRGDVVVHDNKLSFFPMHFYAENLNQVFLADEPGSHNDTYAPASQSAIGLFPVLSISEATNQADRIYFVVFQKSIDEYHAMGYSEHPILAWLGNHYRLINQIPFNDLWIYEFEK